MRRNHIIANIADIVPRCSCSHVQVCIELYPALIDRYLWMRWCAQALAIASAAYVMHCELIDCSQLADQLPPQSFDDALQSHAEAFRSSLTSLFFANLT